MTSPIIPIWLIIPILGAFLVYSIITTRKLKLIIRILMVILLFVINLRIKIADGEVLVMKNNLDVIFVVDTTLSMDALDYNGNGKRMDAVKKDLEYVIDELAGASFSVISFDSIAMTKMPLTRDSNSVLSAIKTLKTPDSLYAKGSTITIFKENLEKVLESSSKREDRRRIVFIVTDGENTTDEKLDSLSDLKQLVDNGAVLGYGTTKGGLMKVETYTGSGHWEYLQDRSDYPYKDARSVIDETNLKKMANDLGLDYIHMEKQSNIKSKIKEILKMRDFNDQEMEYSYQDIYYYFSPILIALFIVELAIDRRMHQ